MGRTKDALIDAQEKKDKLSLPEKREYFRVDYSRCIHLLKKNLKKRCELKSILFIDDSEKEFTISSWLKFSFNSENESWLIDNLIEITNDDLLSFVNPPLLFNVIASLKNLRKITGLYIRIVKNELIIPFECRSLSFSHIFQTVFDKLDKLSLSCNLQIMPHSYISINRCLKIFPHCLYQISHFTEIIKLVELYSKCFPSKPAVCKMQSLSPFSVICPSDTITPFHVSENQNVYLEISRLLYPCINDCPQELLTKPYFQIVPVSIVTERKPLGILNVLKKYKAMNAVVEPLSTGHFRLANYFDFELEMLLHLSLSDVFQRILKAFIDMDLNPALFVKIGDLMSYDKKQPWEYDTIIDYTFSQFLELCYRLRKNDQVLHSGVVKEITYLPCSECLKPKMKQLVVVKGIFGFNLDVLTQTIREKIGFLDTFWKFTLVVYPWSAILGPAMDETDIPCLPLFSYFKDVLEYYPCNEILPPNRCYRYINDENFLVIDKRFVIDKQLVNNAENREKFLNIVNLLMKFEQNEGLILTYDNGLIRRIDNVLIQDQYEKNSVETLRIAVKIFDREELENVQFEVTPKRTILCNGVCEINANLLMEIKNLKLLSEILMAVCVLLPEKSQMFISSKDVLSVKLDSIRPIQNRNDSIEALKKLVKVWNTDLLTFDKELLMENFMNVPIFLAENFNCFIDILQTMRSLNVFLNYIEQDGIINIGNYMAFRPVELQFLNKNCFNQFPRLFWLLENIKVDNGDHIHFTHQAFVNIENFESHLLNLYEPTNRSSRPTVEKNKKDILECFKIFKDVLKNNFIKVRISLNGILFINAVSVLPSIFLSIQKECFGSFFEAVKIYSDLVRPVFSYPGQWVNISDETTKNYFKEAGGFSIVDDNIGTYVKIVNLLQPNLELVPEDIITSIGNVEILPSNFIMKNPEHLLFLLENLKNHGCNVSISDATILCTDSISLSLKKLLKIVDVPKFAETNNLLSALPPAESFNEATQGAIVENLGEKVIITGDRYLLKPSGYLSNKAFKVDMELNVCFSKSHIKDEYMQMVAGKVIRLNTFLRNNGSKLKLTVNSNGNILIGNYIWSRPEVFMSMKDHDILTICETFDQAFLEQYDAMQSISDLENIDSLLALAKELNEMLKYIPDELLKSRYFNVIPKKLKEKLSGDAVDTITRLTSVIKRIKKENMNWLLTFNGHIEIEKCVNLTVDHLLNIINLDEFIQFISFLKLQNLEEQKKLICEEEILLDKYESYKESDQNVPKEILDILCDLKISANFTWIEPDLTILHEKNLWVRPNDYSTNKENVQKLSCMLKNVFGIKSSYRFQFGTFYQRVTTTLLMSSEDQLYEYCRNFCALLKLLDPSIDIKYVVDSHRNPPRHLFLFNNEILLHPRYFFHMKNAKSFVEAMNYYSTSTDTEEIKSQQFLKLIAEIKKEEKIEFKTLKEFVLKEIEKIYCNKKYEEYVNRYLPFVINTKCEDIQIQNNKIFSSGNFNSLIKVSKSGPQLSFKPEQILIALQVAKDFQKLLNFKNTSHLVSLMNAIKEYCDGKNPENKKMVTTKNVKKIEDIFKSEKDYKDMLNIFEIEILMIKTYLANCQHVYRLSSLSSNLHHWFKHGQDFISFIDYYDCMNECIKNCDSCSEEIDTQDGISLIQTFSDKKYIALVFKDLKNEDKEELKTSENDKIKTKTVLTFYKDLGQKQRKKVAKALKKEAEKNRPYTLFNFNEKFTEKYLVITEPSLFNYKGEKLENIGIFFEEKQITHLTMSCNSYKEENSVKIVLLLLNEKYQQKKIKSEEEMKKSLEALLKSLLKAFKIAEIIICKLPENGAENAVVSQQKINDLLKNLIMNSNEDRLNYLEKDLSPEVMSNFKDFLRQIFHE